MAENKENGACAQDELERSLAFDLLFPARKQGRRPAFWRRPFLFLSFAWKRFKLGRKIKTTKQTSLLIGAAAILLATLAVYWPAVQAGFIWDDDDILTANPLIHAPDGLWHIWSGGKFYDYWPLTLTSFWLEWRLWGGQATGYHATNILLHAGAAILLWRALRHLNIPGAWLAALFFAIHPINVQSVAWITERKNTLSLFFFGLALVAYLRSEQARRDAEMPSRKTRRPKGKSPPNRAAPFNAETFWYWISFIAFVLALLSKTSVVLLPVVLLLCAWWRSSADGQPLTKGDVGRTLPFFAAGLVLALVTIWFQYERSIGSDVVAAGDFRSRLVGAGMAGWFYLARIVFPRNPMFVYPRWNFSPAEVVNYLPGVLLLGIWGLSWWHRRRWGRAPFFALTYFLAMLFPVLGFFKIYFQKYSFVSDHWVYPAMIGIIALVTGVGAWLVQKLAATVRPARGRLAKALGMAGAAGAIAVLGPLTWAQCGIYQDEETLWRATLKRNPRCWLAHHNLACLILEKCRSELSANASTPNPAPPGPELTDQLRTALFHEQAALAWKPDHAAAAYGAGHALVLLNQPEEAIPLLRRALELQPDMVTALDGLAWLLATHENADSRDGAEAVRLAQRAVALTGEQDARLLETLAVASAEAGDFPAAIQAAHKALKLALASENQALAGTLAAQLRLFQAGRPLRDRQPEPSRP